MGAFITLGVAANPPFGDKSDAIVKSMLFQNRLVQGIHENGAQAGYKSTGFYEIDPYLESEIPPMFHQYWVFMEKQL